MLRAKSHLAIGGAGGNYDHSYDRADVKAQWVASECLRPCFMLEGNMRASFRRMFINLDRVLLKLASAVLLFCAWSGDIHAGEFKKTNCWFEVPRDRGMTCGTLNVPENRKKASGTEITLSVVVFEPDRERHEPIVFLTGGPGQPTDIGDREDIEAWWQFISDQNWMIGRRVVVVDQRGIGKSIPRLSCSRYFKADHWNSISLSVDAEISFDKLMRDEVVACRSALIANGIDLFAYNTAENAADVNDVRMALGIKKWVLYGVSYGTRVALEVMNEHPEGVSASILDSVLPLDIDYLKEDGRNLDRSLRLLERDCQKSKNCMRGLGDAVRAIVKQLDKQPVLLRSDDGENAPAQYRYVSGADFLELIFGLLYDRYAIEDLPKLVEKTYENDFRPLADMIFEHDDTEIAQGMDFSVTCSETNRSELPDKRLEYWTKWIGEADYTWVCPLWFPQGMTVSQKHPRRLDIPTLLLSGEYDPATPTHWAYRAAKSLPFGQVVVLRGIGHDVIDSDPCGSEVVADFLANPRRKLKTACIGRMQAPQFTAAAEDQWRGPVTQRAAAAIRSPKQMRSPFRFRHRSSTTPKEH
ncbi:alpha/beta hydrolase [Mesorhizobium sp.]|nr:alpha/beta hydrolase [Mesorhizobium sp.]